VTTPSAGDDESHMRPPPPFGDAPPPPRPYPDWRPPKRSTEILVCTAIALGIVGGTFARVADRSAIGGPIVSAFTLTAPALVGSFAAYVAPNPQLRCVIPRAIMSAAVFWVAMWIPLIDIALVLLVIAPPIAVVSGLAHLALTTAVAGVTSLVASLIRARVT
jgi:hypothetical protein